jgi:hypothetical protein
LTGGEAHNCPVVEPLINKTKKAKKPLADKAYDTAELWKALKSEPQNRRSKQVQSGDCQSLLHKPQRQFQTLPLGVTIL